METIPLLKAEPRLAEGLTDAEQAAAAQQLQTPVLNLSDGAEPPTPRRDTAHLLVDGMLLRRLAVGKGRSVELLARGDILAPAREDAASFAHPEWETFEPVRLAAVDLSPRSPIWRWPAICAAIAMRAIDRSRVLAVQSAIMSIVGVEERLYALLWTFCERWGKVTPEGIELELNVHQAVLAEMVGARRPTVSTALSNLSDSGAIANDQPGRWIIKGKPPTTHPS